MICGTGQFHLSYVMHIIFMLSLCVAPPCFCLNGGYYNGMECVCVNNYLGAFCDNSSRIGKDRSRVPIAF